MERTPAQHQGRGWVESAMERRRGWSSGDGAPRDERGGWKKAEIGSPAAMQRRISAEDEIEGRGEECHGAGEAIGRQEAKVEHHFLALASFVSQSQSRSTREMRSAGRCCTANWCILFELEVGSKCRVQPLSCPLGLRWKDWKPGCCGRPAGRSCRIAGIGSRVPMQHRKMARLDRSGRRN